jgi:hypothetical protein
MRNGFFFFATATAIIQDDWPSHKVHNLVNAKTVGALPTVRLATGA